MSNSLPKNVSLTWLGHATALIATPTARVLVDAFTYNNPSCPDSAKDVGALDLLLLTHGHLDHVADAVAIASATGCSVIAQVELAQWLSGNGIDPGKMIEMNRGGTIRFPELGLSVTQTFATHSSSIELAQSDVPVYGGESCGYVVTFDSGGAIYVSGDTSVFSDMRLIDELYRPEVALLPIGDHFTMGPREAALACELMPHVKAVVPIHWGTFGLLTGTPGAFRAEVARRGLATEVLEIAPGETITGDA